MNCSLHGYLLVLNRIELRIGEIVIAFREVLRLGVCAAFALGVLVVAIAVADATCGETERGETECVRPDPMVDTWPGQFIGEGANKKRVWSTRTRPVPAPVAPSVPDFGGYFYSPSLQDWILLNSLGPSRFGFRHPKSSDRLRSGRDPLQSNSDGSPQSDSFGGDVRR
jgi:hypothetical protein